MLTRASAPLHIDIDLASTSTTTSHLATAQTAARDATRDGHGDEEMLSEDDEILLATLPELQQRSAEQQVILEQDEDEEQEERGVEAGDDLFDQVVLWDEQGVPYRTVEGQKVELSQEELEARQELAAGWALEDDEARRASEDELDEEEESEEDDDDEMGDSKSEGEIEAINYEMAKLTESVPALLGAYKLVDRLGEGTFSSVYKAIDLKHADFDNSVWAPSSPTDQPHNKAGKVYVALKRIYVTSSPIRIQNELDILNDLRGTNNVAYLIDALRHEDQVIAVMPFNRHQDFRTYYRTASLPLLRSYFACLFRALASSQTQHIIHRDVKPANFLYDVTRGTGILCDYGLAQKIGGDEWYEWKADCCHSLPGPSWGGLEGRVKSQRKMERLPAGAAPGLASGLHGVRMGRPLSLYEQAARQESEWRSADRKLAAQEESPSQEDMDDHAQWKPWMMPEGWRDDLKNRWRDRQGFLKGWRPASATQGASTNGGRVGYLKEDRRPSVRANRAGTRGFRAPEVLLKCPDQTVSIDIWSAGIILLCFLTRRFPFFNSNDDTEALAEIAAIFGRKKMERCAALHNRTFITNIPNLETPPHPTLHALVKSLNPPIFTENSPDPYGPIPSSNASDAQWYQDSELYNAVDLMKRCLELDCTKRWTAEECLEHPFFNGLYDVGMGVTAPRSEQYM